MTLAGADVASAQSAVGSSQRVAFPIGVGLSDYMNPRFFKNVINPGSLLSRREYEIGFLSVT